MNSIPLTVKGSETRVTAASKAAIDEAKAKELLAQFKGQNAAKVVTVSVGISEILAELGVMPVGVGIKLYTAGGPNGPKVEPSFTNLQELVDDLTASNNHLVEAMLVLPAEVWNVPVESPIGPSTPLEAVGRLMYHGHSFGSTVE
ncbi:hypothetical protein [Paenibacillus roseipurpureus]|uniref:Uncharacterized protein n=1 Tax=Paenibacillus roseopurpureus TaxID=2918901 RepID=A0AA96LNK6_9BACL|nr:hypothetical protein [Paenibacillus sp. MBLB1832]WNR44348.1 hypothetical protein MJB10_25350 [Paenibacillus sp. MBLB1832]